jgi:putative transposase
VYEFIDGQKYAYPIAKMCHWLAVSRSGFYEWRNRPESATTARRTMLAHLVQDIFDDSHGTYGYRRVHAALARRGVPVSPELVRALMRRLGLVACQPRPWRRTTITDPAAPATADLVGRDFTADAPGTKLVGDITYIPTWQGWLYLATVIDCYSKKVIGWAMADDMKTSLVVRAMTMAFAAGEITAGCIFHTDRGTQYTSDEFRTFLRRHDVRPSVGRTGVCWDNAMAESFFGALKNELVHRTVFATRNHARRAVVKYIEGFYNSRRLHSSLGYRTPQEAHGGYVKPQLAA